MSHRTCEMDREDTRNNKEPQSQDLNALTEQLGGYGSRIDVASLAEATFLDELHYIERNLRSAALPGLLLA
jgi:hypothetical protein